MRPPLLCPALLVALVCVAGCYSNDPLYCCTNASNCSEHNGGGVITPCTDPARPYCDADGTYGTPRTCIPDPMGSPCDTPADCSADRPLCLNHECVQCQGNSDCAASTPVCTATNLCGACTVDDDCQGRTDTPRCLIDSGACVACLGPSDCSGNTPVCDANACRGCAADSECASMACDLESGACADEANVIYLSPAGAASGACTRAAPCSSFAAGLTQVTATRNIIKAAPGAYTGLVTIDGVTVTILADGATVTPGALASAVMVVTNGADATIQGLIVDGNGGSTTGLGVRCDVGSTIRLHRSQVVRNGGGGVSISGCQYSLVNDFIGANGFASAVGGVQIANITMVGTHEFTFNAVGGNGGSPGVITGVACATITTPLTFSSSIVYGNTVSNGGTQVGGDSDCTWSYSDIGPDTVGGTGNLNADPLFVDGANRNWHITASSPAKDAADPAATVTIDIDGDHRPQGAGFDMGADEVQ